MELKEHVIKWCSWINKSLTYGKVDKLSVDRFIYLFRNIYFGLSVEDSYDCCRKCMMIRQIKTNQLDYVIEYDDRIKPLNM